MPELDRTERPEPLLGLGNPMPPEPELEDRVIRSLRARGRLRPSRWPHAGRVLGIAAAIAASFAVGRLTPRTSGHGEPRWLLLLYEDPTFDSAPPGGEAARVAEYRAWARATPGIVDGAELAPEHHLLASNGGDGGTPGSNDQLGVLAGYFILSAPSWAEARIVAERCPHLAHRGRIVVRPLVSE